MLTFDAQYGFRLWSEIDIHFVPFLFPGICLCVLVNGIYLNASEFFVELIAPTVMRNYGI